jgi:uncharacterized membrane protein
MKVINNVGNSMRIMKKIFAKIEMKIAILSLFLLGSSTFSYAQCAMCKATVESAGKPFWSSGINSGILYMAAFPYMLLSVVGYIWYRNYQKFKKNGKKIKNSGNFSKQMPPLS